MLSGTPPSLSPAPGRRHSSVVLRLDLVLYCEAFLTTYRTFITPEELIKKLQYRYPFPWPQASLPLLQASDPAQGLRWHQGVVDVPPDGGRGH